ncbi:MAG: ribonuclease T2 [Paracoccus sp. (in: a-proteobacteria)]|nr:ribonuclease T2 [Paracoccus sp. (in: a-proteobacteria)]
MRAAIFLAAALFGSGALAQSGGRHIAGEFDYYVMSLSWSPAWCARTGDRREAEQCAPGRNLGFVLHGLWPNYEDGWPENCRTAERDPARRESQAMADIMGSGGLAWYQWQKHGRCSGLSAAAYYDTSREAFDSITIPNYFQDLARDISLSPRLIEDAFIDANPGLEPDAITVLCRGQDLYEVRICLTKDLDPRACSIDARRDCARDSVIMERIR